ncbi:MAG: TolC family protein [Verrucomicrobiaceae bacterium]|nr:TolC family protein [Verrucomicrobiaceae bacterium]
MFSRPLFILSLCLVSHLSFANETTATTPQSIATIVASAVAHNPEIAFYEAQLAIAKGQRIDAGKQSNPTLTTELSRWSVKDTGDGPAWQAAISQTFEWAGRLGLRKAIADRQIEIAELGLASFKNSLATKVRALAVKALITQEKVAASDEASTRIQDVLAVLVQRDPSGPAPLVETRILEATVLSLTRQTSLMKQELNNTRLELNLLRGVRPETALTIAKTDLTLPEAPDLTALLKAAMKNNFDLRTREAELRQQGFAVSLAYNEGKPAITVQPFVSSQRAGSDKETTAGISVSIPLPLWNRNKGNVAAAEARQQQAQASFAVATREVEKQVVAKASTYATQLEEMSQWRSDSLQRFSEAAQLGNQHYKLGAIPVTTYIELQKSYLDALDALLSTRSEAIANLQDLELLTGLKFLSSTAPVAKN